MIETAIASAFVLTAGNFLYQAVMWGDWGAAFERSFFQIVAIAITVWLIRRQQADAR